jgi:hypothetical protein
MNEGRQRILKGEPTYISRASTGYRALEGPQPRSIRRSQPKSSSLTKLIRYCIICGPSWLHSSTRAAVIACVVSEFPNRVFIITGLYVRLCEQLQAQ